MGLMKSMKSPTSAVNTVILFVVVLLLLVELLPEATSAIIQLSTVPNLGFSGFYESGGVALIVLGAAVLIGIFALIGFGGGKR